MSWYSGPYGITGPTQAIANPSNVNGSPAAAAVQIQNNTPFVLTENIDATVIQPNSAITIPIATGQSLQLNILNYVRGILSTNITATGSISAEWLEAGEAPQIKDGTLAPAQTTKLPFKPLPFVESGGNTILTITPSDGAVGLLWTTGNNAAPVSAVLGIPPSTIGSNTPISLPITEVAGVGGDILYSCPIISGASVQTNIIGNATLVPYIVVLTFAGSVTLPYVWEVDDTGFLAAVSNTNLSLLEFNSAPTSVLTPVINPSASARGILISSTSPPILPPPTLGNYIPINLGALALQYGGNAGSGTWFVATGGQSGFQVEFAAIPTAWAIQEVDYDFDFIEAARALGVYTVFATPTTGADWTYTLPCPGRLVTVLPIFAASAAAANRFAFLFGGNFFQVPMNQTAWVAGQDYNITGYVGGPQPPSPNPTQNTAGSFVPNFGIPNAPLLPPGTVIDSNTNGLQAGDRWLQIALTFAPI